MPIPTAGAEMYHATIALPAGADAQTRASFANPLEELADRTAFLRAYIKADGSEFVYPVSILGTKTRKLVVLPSEAMLSRASGSYSEWLPSTIGSSPIIVPTANGAKAWLPLKIPSGCTITDLEVIVRSNAARSSPNGWVAKLFTQTHDWSTPGAPTTTQQGSTVEGGLASGYSKITITSITPFLLAAEQRAFVQITGPTGSPYTNDALVGVRATFTDAGPRNA